MQNYVINPLTKRIFVDTCQPNDTKLPYMDVFASTVAHTSTLFLSRYENTVILAFDSQPFALSDSGCTSRLFSMNIVLTPIDHR